MSNFGIHVLLSRAGGGGQPGGAGLVPIVKAFRNDTLDVSSILCKKEAPSASSTPKSGGLGSWGGKAEPVPTLRTDWSGDRQPSSDCRGLGANIDLRVMMGRNWSSRQQYQSEAINGKRHRSIVVGRSWHHSDLVGRTMETT